MKNKMLAIKKINSIKLVLMDYVDVVVHVFKKDARDFII